LKPLLGLGFSLGNSLLLGLIWRGNFANY